MLKSVWEDFLKIAKEEVGSRVVETWLKAVTLNKWDYLQKTIYIKAPNTFVKEWIRSHYLELFHIHLSRLLNVDTLTIIFLDQSKETPTVQVIEKNIDGKTNNTVTKFIANDSVKLPKTNLPKNKGYINSSYLFNTFVVGPNNSLAYAAAYAVTQKPGTLYNPLFIYGKSGLGKTHLLHAIGNEIKSLHKDYVVLYQTADRFVNEFINAIRFDKIYLFKEKYKDIDVLLIDDIQFISNKEQTQEAFFHIFNSLYEARKQIVFSSDNYPKDIEGLASRLRTRLEWGLITDIYAPTFETKIAILKKKLESNNNEPISDDVIYFIASKVDTNIRELEGYLIRVLAFANLTNQSVTLELAQKVLSNANQKPNNIITFNDVAKSVGKKYSYTLSELQSKNRNKEISLVRQIAMYMMKQLTDKSLQEIGLFLKRRDHSTVVHAIQKIQKLRESDQNFNLNIKQLEDEISR